MWHGRDAHESWTFVKAQGFRCVLNILFSHTFVSKCSEGAKLEAFSRKSKIHSCSQARSSSLRQWGPPVHASATERGREATRLVTRDSAPVLSPSSFTSAPRSVRRGSSGGWCWPAPRPQPSRLGPLEGLLPDPRGCRCCCSSAAAEAPPPRRTACPTCVVPQVQGAGGRGAVSHLSHVFPESIYRRGARRWRKLYRANGHLFQAKRFNRVSATPHPLPRAAAPPAHSRGHPSPPEALSLATESLFRLPSQWGLPFPRMPAAVCVSRAPWRPRPACDQKRGRGWWLTAEACVLHTAFPGGCKGLLCARCPACSRGHCSSFPWFLSMVLLYSL